MTPRINRDHVLWLLLHGLLSVVFMVALYARWPSAPTPSLWSDEAWRALAVSRTGGIADFLRYMSLNSEVLLFSEWTVGKLSWLVAGSQPFAYRFWPFLFSLVAMVGMYAVMKRLQQEALAPIPLLCIAASFAFVYHSREFKPYALDLALSIWLLWAVLDARERDDWRAVIVLASITAWSSLAFVFVYPGIALFLCSRSTMSVRRVIYLALPMLQFMAVYFLFLQPQNAGGTISFWSDNYLYSPEQAYSLVRDRYGEILSTYTLSYWEVASILFFVVLPVCSIWRRDGLVLLFFSPLFLHVAAACLRIYPILDRPTFYYYGWMVLGAVLGVGRGLDLVVRSPSWALRAAKVGLAVLFFATWILNRGQMESLQLARQWPGDTAASSMRVLADSFAEGDQLHINSGAYYSFLFHYPDYFPEGHSLKTIWDLSPPQPYGDENPERLDEVLHGLQAGSQPGLRSWYLSGFFPQDADVYQRLLSMYGDVVVHVSEPHQLLLSVVQKENVVATVAVDHER